MGITTSVRMVELIIPPITAVASSAPITTELLPEETASGTSAMVVVTAVISMGRSRTRPASIVAS